MLAHAWQTRGSALVLGGLLSVGCLVPKSQLDEAETALEQERQAHTTTEQQLDALSKRLSQVEQTLRKEAAELEACEQELAQADYAQAVVVKERDDAKALVAQLREELDRVAKHIEAYGQRNRALEKTVGEMQAEAKRLEQAEADADERAKLLRDLALELEPEAKRGSVQLAISGGVAVIKLDPRKVFTGKRLTESGRVVARAVVKLLGPLKNRRLELHWQAPPERQDERQGRLGPLVDALVKGGIEQKRIRITDKSAIAEPDRDDKEWVEIVVRRAE